MIIVLSLLDPTTKARGKEPSGPNKLNLSNFERIIGGRQRETFDTFTLSSIQLLNGLYTAIVFFLSLASKQVRVHFVCQSLYPSLMILSCPSILPNNCKRLIVVRKTFRISPTVGKGSFPSVNQDVSYTQEYWVPRNTHTTEAFSIKAIK